MLSYSFLCYRSRFHIILVFYQNLLKETLRRFHLLKLAERMNYYYGISIFKELRNPWN